MENVLGVLVHEVRWQDGTLVARHTPAGFVAAGAPQGAQSASLQQPPPPSMSSASEAASLESEPEVSQQRRLCAERFNDGRELPAIR